MSSNPLSMVPSSHAVFAQSQQPARGCGAFRLGFDGGLGGEAEETALFLPVMRQVFAQSQQPAHRRTGRRFVGDAELAEGRLLLSRSGRG
jgi:hypothetical protein